MILFQNLVQQVKHLIDIEIGVIDETGLILASSNEQKLGDTNPAAKEVAKSKEQVVFVEGIAYQKIFIKNKLEFIAYIASCDEDSIKILALFSINVANIRAYNEEKFDKNNFIKNIITDNILPGDIHFRSRELRLAYNALRIVFLIKTEKNRDMHTHEVVQSLFPRKTKDFVIALDSENTALIRELKTKDSHEEIEKTAKIIVNTLGTELMIKANVGIGSVVDNLRDIGRSFKEAQTALLVGGIFESDKSIVNYNSLGIGRLIYQLPPTLCKLFLREVFEEGAYEALDDEILLTIQKFFENSLNISETSRQLYVHRNTLVYRLDKIQKITGLDLRKFDDAITFKVALLVKRYLDKAERMF
jgi:carbohydrate diacid regulator